MQKLRRILKILGLIALMTLASVGIGLTGAAPTLQISQKKNKAVNPIENVDSDDKNEDNLEQKK